VFARAGRENVGTRFSFFSPACWELQNVRVALVSFIFGGIARSPPAVRFPCSPWTPTDNVGTTFLSLPSLHFFRGMASRCARGLRGSHHSGVRRGRRQAGNFQPGAAGSKEHTVVDIAFGSDAVGADVEGYEW
jgi:hypothetical protein